ncbi:MAG TPA: response regulator [Anaeromyxobacteraceae bacterium]|nr:response regulator [Anaeromyxobacteraceae bacterium]
MAADTVLVVDDDADVREMLTESLRAEGFAVISADEGRKALELAESLRPAVILLDLTMEGMDGRAFLEARRSRAAVARTPVIVITGAPDRTIQSDLQLPKPLALEEVVSAVRRLARPDRRTR